MSISSKTIITNDFVNGMQALVNADNSTSGVNLVELANYSEVTLSELLHVYTQAINGLLGSKDVVLNELTPADMLCHLRLKQAFKRHSAATTQQKLLREYERPEAANILSHIKTTNKGLVFSSKTIKAKLNNFTCFDCFEGKIIVLGSPKFDNDTQQYEPNVSVTDANIDEMITSFNVWRDGLNDSIPLLSSDSSTHPQNTVELIDASVVDNVPVVTTMLQKELQNSRDIVHLKEQDIKKSSTEIDNLKARIVELEKENKSLFNKLSPAKQKALKAA